jgi:pilus assembly protein CpaE
VSDRTLSALDASDRVILLTQLSVPGIRSTKRTLELFDRLGYPESKALIVVNRHHSGDVVTVPDAREVLGRDIYWKIPNDYRGFANALTGGAPLVNHNPASPVAKSFVQLAAKLGGASAPATNGKADHASRLGRLLRMGRKN